MDWELILSSPVTSAAISFAGVLLSALIAKITATKTAKITARAEMDRLMVEHAHTDKVRIEDRAWGKEDSAHDAYKELFAATTEYMVKPDRNTKSAAITACSNALLIATAPRKPLDELLTLIQCSDAFDGVDSAVVTPLLLQIVSDR